MSAAQVWQPVLYGRTYRADRWWRLRPGDMDPDWLTAAALACADGGDGLAAGPRMLLARRGDAVLVGGAGRASLLSDTMNSDGSRPLFCFAGWLTRTSDPVLPALADLERHWVSWAAEIYGSWMPLDWKRHPSDLGVPHESPFVAAPWSAAAAAEPPAGPAGRPRQVRGMWVVPPSDRERCWYELSRFTGDFAYATAFDQIPLEFAGPLTHVGSSADVPDVAEPPADPVPAAAPAEEASPPPDPAPGPETHTEPEKGRFRRGLGSILGGGHRADEPAAPTPSGPAKDLDYWRAQETRKGRRDPERRTGPAKPGGDQV
ncbi:hypothetical protein [Paractinoplanes rishiriensis]|uniref:Uncharacterized protein n=1 Tax=Paractinoplanes rishiriensis TaxID=1050105 RepID=A0A919JTC1_9ACTN|nr:hypothetical protein [Actinoplanes rishiriensis]GIE94408.1 hypothetical protein Ari01nite_18730 [Actinoplanes rishiriensis]